MTAVPRDAFSVASSAKVVAVGTTRALALVVLLGAVTACGDDDLTTTSVPPGTEVPIETTVTTVDDSLPSPSSTVGPTTPAAPTSTSLVVSTVAPTTAAPPVPPSGAPTIPETTVSSSPSSNAAAAVTDLANNLGVDPATIVVTDEHEVTWPDSSLGCPEPGMQYLQQLTNGVLLVLEVDGTRYEYHGGGGRPLFLCTKPRPPVEGP